MITSLPRFVSNVVRIGSWNTVELFCFLCLLRRVFSVCLPLYKLHIPFRKVRVSSASQMTWKKMAETTEKRDVMSSCLTHDAKMTRETWRLKGKDEDDDDTHEEDGHEETWERHSMKSCLLFLEEQSLPYTDFSLSISCLIAQRGWYPSVLLFLQVMSHTMLKLFVLTITEAWRNGLKTTRGFFGCLWASPSSR